MNVASSKESGVRQPQFILIAGANGSGKSTSAPLVLAPSVPYLNADDLARELAATGETKVDLIAGRRLLEKWDEHVSRRSDFGVETTLSSRSLAPRIVRLREVGYEFTLLFFWLANVELAVSRVAERVRKGGHDIPEPVIRRWYRAGLINLRDLYLPLADRWKVYDNSRSDSLRLIASGEKGGIIRVYETEVWTRIQEGGTNGPE